MEYNFEKIGNRIREERKKAGYRSQDDLIDALHNKGFSVGRNTISDIETGKTSHYDFDLLVALSELFKCGIGHLLCQYEARTPEAQAITDLTGLNPEAAEKLISRKDDFCDSSKHFLDFLLLDDNLLDAINRYCFIARTKEFELEIPTYDQAIKSKSLPEGYELVDKSKKSVVSNIHKVKTSQPVVANGFRIDDLMEETAMTIIRKCLDKLRDRLNKEYTDNVSQIDKRYL